MTRACSSRTAPTATPSKANLGFKPTRRPVVRRGADISYRQADTPNPSVDPFTYAYFANPYEKPYNDDGSYANDQTWLSLPNYNRDTYEDLPEKGFNILREIEGNKTKTDYVSTEVRMGLEYKLLENLKFVGLASYNFNNNDTQTTQGGGHLRGFQGPVEHPPYA